MRGTIAERDWARVSPDGSAGVSRVPGSRDSKAGVTRLEFRDKVKSVGLSPITRCLP